MSRSLRLDGDCGWTANQVLERLRDGAPKSGPDRTEDESRRLRAAAFIADIHGITRFGFEVTRFDFANGETPARHARPGSSRSSRAYH